jgi:hypothetical protein
VFANDVLHDRSIECPTDTRYVDQKTYFPARKLAKIFRPYNKEKKMLIRLLSMRLYNSFQGMKAHQLIYHIIILRCRLWCKDDVYFKF